jgi:hypothetical protein
VLLLFRAPREPDGIGRTAAAEQQELAFVAWFREVVGWDDALTRGLDVGAGVDRRRCVALVRDRRLADDALAPVPATAEDAAAPTAGRVRTSVVRLSSIAALAYVLPDASDPAGERYHTAPLLHD